MSDNNIIELENLKSEIEKLSKEHHVSILKILKKETSITLNENKNGTFLNLTEVPSETLESLLKYCSYVKNQNDNLNDIEIAQKEIESSFFS